MARVGDLTQFLTATGVALGRSNGLLTVANVPTILQSLNVTVNLFGPISVPVTSDTIALAEPESLTAQILPVLGMELPTLSITASYVAAPSLIPVPPT